MKILESGDAYDLEAIMPFWNKQSTSWRDALGGGDFHTALALDQLMLPFNSCPTAHKKQKPTNDAEQTTGFGLFPINRYPNDGHLCTLEGKEPSQPKQTQPRVVDSQQPFPSPSFLASEDLPQVIVQRHCSGAHIIQMHGRQTSGLASSCVDNHSPTGWVGGHLADVGAAE